MTVDLRGRVAIVTGAGQGIGRGIALALATAGASVVVAGRTRSKLDDTVAAITVRGGTGVAVTCDVQRLEQIRACIGEVVDRYGRLDILVNNAQAIRYAGFNDSTDDDLQEAWESGPLATFRFMRLSYPHLRETRGVVINLGSSATLLHDTAFYGPYTAAKAAIEALTRSAACEWGPDGIRALVIDPAAETAMTAGWKQRDPDGYNEAVGKVPLRRFGDCEHDIGGPVAWLASDDAGYLTGTTIMLDGGGAFLR
jgi:meso-butanediol dehydrogenase/(S,S)-butanediol dehydrogenase/diacetyl reductase